MSGLFDHKPLELSEADQDRIVELMHDVADRTREDPPDLAGELNALRDGDTDVCHCGYDIVWRVFPPVPYPELLTEWQKQRRKKGGRWVHVHDGKPYCPLTVAYPAKRKK